MPRPRTIDPAKPLAPGAASAGPAVAASTHGAADAPAAGPAAGPGPGPVVSTRQTLRRSVIDGTAWAVMVGIGELQLAAFLLALTRSEVASAWVVTLTPLLGGFLQLLGPAAVRRLGSHKRWVVGCCVAQCVSFVPLIVGALTGGLPAWVAFACATLYFAGGMAAGVAWSTWIGTLVPRRVRPRWFGLRARMQQAGTLTGFVCGGLVLYLAAGGRPPSQAGDHADLLTGFAALFVVAMLCRAISAYHLASIPEPEPVPAGYERVPLGAMWDRWRRRTPEATFLVHVFSLMAAASLAAPFINPYLLQHQGYDHFRWTLIVGTVTLLKVACLPAWARFAGRFGSGRMLLIGGVGAAPIGLMWAVSDHPGWILFTQIYSGAVWAAWELACTLMILERIAPAQRTAIMGWYMLGITLATAAGAGLAGLIQPWAAQRWGDGAGYATIFTLSTIARCACIPLLVSVAGVGRARAGVPTRAVPPAGP